jgi:hypothetical protein
MAFCMVLRGAAVAQESANAPQANMPLSLAPASDPGPGLACRQCGNASQVNLALSPDCWPPVCRSCDVCDPLQSCCPDADEYFLVPPRLRWYAAVDGAAIRRNPSHSVNFASLGILPTGSVSPTDVVLSTGDFNYDLAGAGRVVVGHTVNECLQIEVAYLGVSQAENTAAVRDSTPNAFGGVGNLFSPFGGFGRTPILGLDYNDFAQIRYTSSFQSFELNIRQRLATPPGRLTSSVFFGVRYIGILEDFQYDTHSNVTRSETVVADGALNSIHIAAGNEMVGPQIGALCEVYTSNRWWINVEMKGAVLNNRARQATDYRNVDNGITTATAGYRQEDHTAFAEELALTLIYRWSPQFITHIGYQALWLQDVALAPDNLNTNVDILTLGPAQLNHRSNTVYHGPFAGIVLGW